MNDELWEYIPPLGSHVELPRPFEQPPLPADEDFPDDYDDDLDG